MTAFAGRTWWILFALATLLLSPLLLSPLQSTLALEKFHNRRLTMWPDRSRLIDAPTQYIRSATDWLDDRIWPIMDASAWQKRVLFHLFRTPPQKRVSMGADNHVFLNGADDVGRNGILVNTCIDGHTPEIAQKLRAALDDFSVFAERMGVQARVVIVPMSASTLARYLPETVPGKIRRACLALHAQRSPMLALAHRYRNLTFPFVEFVAAGADPSFFPAGNYHPMGLSILTVRDAFFAANGLTPAGGETLTPVMRPSEVLGRYGIEKPYPSFDVTNPAVAKDIAAGERLAVIAQPFITSPVVVQSYRTDVNIGRGHALMISDSTGYGPLREQLALEHSIGYGLAPAFASGYHRLSWISHTGIKQGDMRKLLTELHTAESFTTIIIAANEGAIPTLADWLLNGSRTHSP